MTDVTEASPAFKTATRILTAIQKKFPKYIPFVRIVKTGDFSFIELALRPEKGSHLDEVTTAYSEMYFNETTEDNIKARAGRIHNDFRILMGLEPLP